MTESLSREEYVCQKIRLYVWSGFYSSQDIEDIVIEYTYAPGKVAVDWVRGRIDQEFAAKLEQQLEWPEKTDCDRLDEVFATLEGSGIIALQNTGYNQSDGMEEVSKGWRARGSENSGVVGYCFYHGLDLQRAVDGEALQLTFGHIGGDDGKGIAIGNMICDEFRRNDFTVVWNEEINTRIQIRGIDWKRRTREY